MEKFIEISRKHKCTPLQFEVLSAVAERQDADQLQRVVKATEAVHGAAQTQVGLIAALAENGQGNALRKTLIVRNKIFVCLVCNIICWIVLSLSVR